MQTQLFLHQQRTDQTTPLISGTLLGPQHETDVAPFAEFVQQLPDASAPDLVEITTTSEGQAAAQNEQGIDETGLLMAESEDRNRTAHLAIEGGEKTVLTTDHQGTSVSSQLLEVRIGQNAQVDDPTTAGKFFDQDPPVCQGSCPHLYLSLILGGRDRIMTWDIHKSVNCRC